ncbi:MAG: right-handed parallel beta-helix repeat-containing protein [Planctomycetaceae bacterium]|nr:right-handed parallel beta-helix repeat-containing protein [Planctomycetaceae bacterium]
MESSRFAMVIMGLLTTVTMCSESVALDIRQDTRLDPDKVYESLVIKASNITIDGRGAWIVGEKDQPSNKLKGVAIRAEGVSNVTLKNVNAKGWETGLRIVGGSGWTIENCNFSDNFHDPEFGWGENGRRGGIVLDRVTKSTLRKNKANRVWDACVLVNSDDNLLEENDFSHTSNTCLKLWTASRNTIRKNVLSHGIRIKPGEVHARDSTSVLIESGSNENRLIENDCSHGGDGIFVRVLNGWCSTGNLFESNDCSFANNNGVECWAPRNVFVKNKANHCSYGFWLGGSDQSRLIGNEASFNGLKSGHHNSPHLPQEGHAGIVFMFGPSSHTVCRGNVCRENNGAGIALIGDLDSQGKKWQAYHWIIEQNTLTKNRWGIYAKHADWITLSGNRFDGNSVKNVQLDGGVTRWEENSQAIAESAQPPIAKLIGPTSVKLGERAAWEALSSRDPANRELKLTWDIGDGRLLVGPKLEHTFDRVGFHRVGLNVSNGWLTDLAWRDVYVVRDVTEIGTEGSATNWSIEDFHDRTRSNEQISRAKFADDTADKLVGKSALGVVIAPYAGFRAALTFPKSRDAQWSLEGKTKLVFWLKATNEDVTGWQGGPFIRLDGEAGQQCHIEPKPGLDHMRNAEHNEARDGWRLFEIPLRANDQWQTSGDLPDKVRALALCFDSWGAPTLRFTIDGLAFE